ncbi:MAG: hypothetical protein NZ699_03480 [Roseiflexus sp.]|nr:hypothetical protein [Roseiflexus sp.]MCS7288174.1 hypothetical protein [Roseiflexus sp.]MDW8145982.1 hypothetical protein [Roseiflexaceae bacterium]MDW8232997.1 hypothetical protein [Roseiflexaceae bacterium]
MIAGITERPTFTGTDEQRALAEEIFQLMVAQARLFALDAPIRQTLKNLADFYARQRQMDLAEAARLIDEALRVNDHVFTRQETNGDVVFITSRRGRYVPPQVDTIHTFKQRLYEPENPLPVDDISVVVTTTRPALTTVEPVFISEYWQQQAGLIPVVVEQPAETPVEPVVKTPEVAAPVSVSEPVPETVSVTPPSEPTQANTVIVLPNGLQIDLRRPVEELMAQHGNTLMSQLRIAIENDPLRRLVLFGNRAFPEAALVSFGKNDLRRISDYIKEVGEPLLDTQIIADIFYHNPRQSDYEIFRFALNYRLSREKDFEFVGVEGACLWSVRNLPAIGTKRVKASEMGQLAGYIEEGFDDSLAEQSIESIRKSGQVSHVLTFFEWEYGILPLTRALAALLPQPLLSDQRSAVLRFELPQHYVSTLVELRYPTGNRGGWLQGLEALFHDYLVPGALITLMRTDDPRTFAITYEEQEETQDRLLVLDETKKMPKFTFANMSYTCVVDTDMLVNQQQYGRLRNLKAFPMNERRKADLMLEHVFEVIGTPVGTRTEPKYAASLDMLFVALNVLRPASREYLSHLLAEGDRFVPDASRPGWWFYTPPPLPEEEEEEDQDEASFDEEE